MIQIIRKQATPEQMRQMLEVLGIYTLSGYNLSFFKALKTQSE
jgi:hypothetical protein